MAFAAARTKSSDADNASLALAVQVHTDAPGATRLFGGRVTFGMFKSKSEGTFRFALTCAAVALASAVLAAQATSSVKDIRKQLVLTQDVRVGASVLATGRYQVSSKNQELTFRRLRPDPAYGGQWIVDSGHGPVVVKCTVSVLDAKSDSTRLEMAPGNGVPTVSSLTFEGSNVKFTIAP